MPNYPGGGVLRNAIVLRGADLWAELKREGSLHAAAPVPGSA